MRMRRRSQARNLAEYGLALAVLTALAWVPLPVARWLAAGLGSLLRLLTPHWAEVAETNLRLAMPELDLTARRRIIGGVYAHLGRVLLAVARLPRLHAGNIRQWIHYEGLEHYEAALARGKGVLFLTAHLGNWELSAAAHALFGHPMSVLVRPLDNPRLDRLLQRYRTRCGNRAIGKQDAAAAILRALRRNEPVGILIDQNAAGEDGLFVDFFGVKARATSGLARLAMRSGAAVIPGFALWREEEQRYVLRFDPALEMVSTGDDSADLETNTQSCQQAIERVVREYPEQWLWIHRRWKSRPPGDPPIYG